MNINWAIYCRVSTSDQTSENQRTRLIEYARQREWTFEVFEETESTRKTRPIKAELLNLLRQKKYHGVLVWKLDRWARSCTELILEIQELIDKGVCFVSLTDSIDFSTSVGKLQFQILSAFADFERSLISERTKQGLERLKVKGVKLGRPKGSKDRKARKRSGYILREATKRKVSDSKKGVHKPLNSYIDG